MAEECQIFSNSRPQTSRYRTEDVTADGVLIKAADVTFHQTKSKQNNPIFGLPLIGLLGITFNKDITFLRIN